MPELLCQQEVMLREKKYLVYLKQVPTKLGKNGLVEATTIRAFIRQV